MTNYNQQSNFDLKPSGNYPPHGHTNFSWYGEDYTTGNNYKEFFSNEVLRLNDKSRLSPSLTGEYGQNGWHDIVHFFFLFKKRGKNIHAYMFSPFEIDYYRIKFGNDVLQLDRCATDDFGNVLQMSRWYNIVKEWKSNLLL